MARAYRPDSPLEAHTMACAIGRDAANAQMRAAGRAAWNQDDANRCAHATQQMYQLFGILNAECWMPEGYAWLEDATGNIRPVRVS